MIDLFGPEGLAALDRLARARTLYAFDFDGTLAPIVAVPDNARAAPTTIALLTAIGARVPTLILTGRGTDDLRRLLPFASKYVVGNHGAEGMPDAPAGDPAHRAVVEAWLAQWPAAIAESGAVAGLAVEPKRYSLSIHYRQADDHAAAERAIDAAIGRLDPRPRVIGGKCVLNLLPEGAPDKGSALRALVRIEHCDAAFFIGDDLTDEAAFEQAPPSWVTVRVGQSAASAARYFIPDQKDIDRCLERLLAAVEAADRR